MKNKVERIGSFKTSSKTELSMTENFLFACDFIERLLLLKRYKVS